MVISHNLWIIFGQSMENLAPTNTLYVKIAIEHGPNSQVLPEKDGDLLSDVNTFTRGYGK